MRHGKYIKNTLSHLFLHQVLSIYLWELKAEIFICAFVMFILFFPSSFLFFKSLELYYICKAQTVFKAVYNSSHLNLHNTSGKKVVPQFPPQTAVGRKSESLSVAKEVGHVEIERSEIHVLRTLEFCQFLLNKVSFSDVV